MSELMNEELVTQAERLLDALRQGDEEAARQALMNLTAARESMLFKEIGALARDLHDALRHFAEDVRLKELTKQEMPDARERLRYVTTLTEQAANRTLDAAEQALPLTDNLIQRSMKMKERLVSLRKRHPDNQVLQDALGPIETYLGSVRREGELMRSKLHEIIMAQEFQDLSGQLLHQVILLLERIESELIDLIRLVGQEARDKEAEEGEQARSRPQDEAAVRAQGPALPGQEGVVQSQDEVDALLASLGF